MYFLLNDAVFDLDRADLADSLIARRFAAIDFDFVQSLGQELFAEQPLAHRTHPERAAKLCALIRLKDPSINAALFIAPAHYCAPRDVGVRYARLKTDVIEGLQSLYAAGALTSAVADREVWRRLAA
jgi:hypothetical protein